VSFIDEMASIEKKTLNYFTELTKQKSNTASVLKEEMLLTYNKNIIVSAALGFLLL
jgi:hypothetical protein